MAMFISTESDGSLSYEIEPNDKQVLSKNVNYLPEAAKSEIESDLKDYVDDTKDDIETDYKAYVNDIISNVDVNDEVKIDHVLITKNYGGAGAPIVSSTTDGNRVGFAGALNLNTLNLSVQNGTAGSSFTTRAVSLGGSDKRLKDNIKPCKKSGLDIINALKVVEFDWIDTKKHWDFGIIAQDAKKIDDNIVIGKETDDSFLSVDMLYLIDVLIKAVQELTNEIKVLKEKGD